MTSANALIEIDSYGKVRIGIGKRRSVPEHFWNDAKSLVPPDSSAHRKPLVINICL